MPTIQRLVTVLNNTLTEAVDPATVTAATPLDSFGVDSLVLIDLIFDIEQEFSVKIAAEELMTLKTIGELAALIEQRAK